jgi:hypothetical protein
MTTKTGRGQHFCRDCTCCPRIPFLQFNTYPQLPFYITPHHQTWRVQRRQPPRPAQTGRVTSSSPDATAPPHAPLLASFPHFQGSTYEFPECNATLMANVCTATAVLSAQPPAPALPRALPGVLPNTVLAQLKLQGEINGSTS